MAAEYQQLMAIGKELGLQNADLKVYISEQQAILRDNREADRNYRREEEERKLKAEERRERIQAEEAARKEQNELELRRMQLQLASEESARRMQMESEESARKLASEEAARKLASEEVARKEQNELEFRREQMAAETELKKMELELRAQQEANQSRRSDNDGNVRHRPTGLIKLGLPNFRENIDDLSQYLLRFEHTCERMEIPTGEWGLYLARQLEGKAMDVYERLSREDMDNYEILKGNLMKRFHLTEEDYRKRYKRCKMDAGETHPQFVERLKRNLDKWRESAELEATYGDLRELVLRDQYFEVCSPELQVFIKEKDRLISNVWQNMLKFIRRPIPTKKHLKTRNTEISKDKEIDLKQKWFKHHSTNSSLVRIR